MQSRPYYSLMPDSEHDPDRPAPEPPLGQPIAAMGHGVRSVVRIVAAGFGVFFIVIGVPLAMITPFPFVPIGLPVVILGVVLLGRNSVTGRRWMEGVLVRYPKVERFAPHWLMKLVFGRDKRVHEPPR